MMRGGFYSSNLSCVLLVKILIVVKLKNILFVNWRVAEIVWLSSL